MRSSNKNSNYRKNNEGSLSSSKYHKLDGTPQRAILKEETRKEFEEEVNGRVKPIKAKSESKLTSSDKDFLLKMLRHTGYFPMKAEYLSQDDLKSAKKLVKMGLLSTYQQFGHSTNYYTSNPKMLIEKEIVTFNISTGVYHFTKKGLEL